jgi:hypothetical protein
MWGQLRDEAFEGAGLVLGAFVVLVGAFGVVGVVDVEEAALAMAAPPPARAPVMARVVIRGLALTGFSPPFGSGPQGSTAFVRGT